jgi:hypothetical protein
MQFDWDLQSFIKTKQSSERKQEKNIRKECMKYSSPRNSTILSTDAAFTIGLYTQKIIPQGPGPSRTREEA